jgi:hypothetical protein
MSAAIQPRDVALFLLASGEMLPRQRARDQQADRAGLDLKRAVLERLIALDPEDDELDQALQQIVLAIGPPHGPTRAICLSFRDEWQDVADNPRLAEWMLEEALRESAQPTERKGRRGKQRNQ